MCNLYRMTKAADEVARLFGVDAPAGTNVGEEVFPGYPGLVLDAAGLRSMTWGFPLSLKGKSGRMLKPKPVNNARCDKLDSFMWRYSFAERRCLIPMTGFAEAEGPKGTKTRSWFSLPDQPVFTAAGIWRQSDEWGAVYSMVMTDAAPVCADLHDRSPVLLDPGQRDLWMRGSPEEALSLCTPYAGLMQADRTAEPWVQRAAAS